MSLTRSTDEKLKLCSPGSAPWCQGGDAQGSWLFWGGELPANGRRRGQAFGGANAQSAIACLEVRGSRVPASKPSDDHHWRWVHLLNIFHFGREDTHTDVNRIIMHALPFNSLFSSHGRLMSSIPTWVVYSQRHASLYGLYILSTGVNGQPGKLPGHRST
jgi:hypothetical protein